MVPSAKAGARAPSSRRVARSRRREYAQPRSRPSATAGRTCRRHEPSWAAGPPRGGQTPQSCGWKSAWPFQVHGGRMLGGRMAYVHPGTRRMRTSDVTSGGRVALMGVASGLEADMRLRCPDHGAAAPLGTPSWGGASSRGPAGARSSARSLGAGPQAPRAVPSSTQSFVNFSKALSPIGETHRSAQQRRNWSARRSS